VRKIPLENRATEQKPSERHVPSHLREIDLRSQATIHFSSEDPAEPIEHMLDGRSGPGASRWVSARPDTTEELLIEFDEPQCISHIAFEVEESRVERTQQILAECSSDRGATFRQVFVQEYTFSPNGATYEYESLAVELRDVTHLRVLISPNKSGSGKASLTSLRLFS
jgi:hypothetical protein